MTPAEKVLADAAERQVPVLTHGGADRIARYGIAAVAADPATLTRAAEALHANCLWPEAHGVEAHLDDAAAVLATLTSKEPADA